MRTWTILLLLITLPLVPATTKPQQSIVPPRAILDGTIGYVQFCANERYVMAGTYDGMIYLWETTTGKCWRKINTAAINESHPKIYTGISITPDGQKLFVSQSNIWKWDTSHQELDYDPVNQWSYNSLHHKWIKETVNVWRELNNSGRLAISPDGHYVGISREIPPYNEDEEVIQVYTIKGKRICQSKQRYAPIRSLTFSPDGKSLLFGTVKGLLVLISRHSGRELWRSQGDMDQVASVAFSPNGAYIASGSGKTTSLWKMEIGKAVPVWQVKGENFIRSIAFDPDGRLVITMSDSTTLWDVKTKKPAHTYNTAFNCVSISSNGKYLLSGGMDRTVQLWNMKTGSLVRYFEFPTP